MDPRTQARCLAGFLGAATLLTLAGCKTAPSCQSFGWQVVEIRADSGRVASAVYATHHEMADWKAQGDGKKSDPSFSDHGRSWNADDRRMSTGIVETRFRSKAGADCAITRIELPDRPILVLLKSDDDKSSMELHNAFVRNLVKGGVQAKR